MTARMCSRCGHPLDRRVFCSECKRELLCGKVSEPCPNEGCAETRSKPEHEDALGYMEYMGEEALVAPRRS